MKTTKKRGTDFGFLKSIIVLGSLLATLIGGDLLAKQTTQTESNPTNTDTITVIQPTTKRTSIDLGNNPMVQLVIPEPVTNSRSSG